MNVGLNNDSKMTNIKVNKTIFPQELFANLCQVGIKIKFIIKIDT